MLIDKIKQRISELGQYKTLDNGVTLITEHTPDLGLAQGGIFLNIGTENEKKEDYGIMHFLEHLCLNRSKKYYNREETNMIFSRLGFVVNAQTGVNKKRYPILGANNTNFVLKENLIEGLDIVTERAFLPIIEEEDYLREKAVVLSEIREDIDFKKKNPRRELSKEIKKLIFPKIKKIIELEPLGSVETVENKSIEKLLEYHNNFYVGANTGVYICGDLDEKLRKEIEEIILKIPVGEEVKLIDKPEEDKFNGIEFIEYESSFDLKFLDLHINYRIPPVNSKEHHIYGILSKILCKGPNGFLFKKLREQEGFVYSIKNSIVGEYKTGNFSIKFSLEEEHVDKTIETVYNSIEKIKRGDFDERIIEGYKTSQIPSLIFQSQTAGGVLNELISRYNKDKIGFGASNLEQTEYLLNIKKEDVIEAANKYFNEDKQIIIVR